jgi:ABC-2 type transport system permease protein
MTTHTMPASGMAAVPSTACGRAAGRLAVRQIGRGALIVTAVCAGMSAMVVTQYQAMFDSELDQSALRALAENPAIRTLFGPAVALDDAGGFTVWRTGTPLLVLAGVWILLAATRITRGEEDAGRWDLLLSGRLRAVDLVLRCLAAVAGCALVISAAVGLALLAAGTDGTGVIIYATAILGVTLTFATAGVLAAQIMPTRPAAVGLTVGILGVALLLRMLADGAPQLAWSAWATPFGLVSRAAPYAENRIAPLLVLVGVPVVLALTAIATARTRDVGSGVVAVATSWPPRTRLLMSICGFAVRRAVRPTIGWMLGIAAYFLLVGALIASILEFFDKNNRFAELATAAGFAGLDSAEGFAAALFSMLAIPTGLYSATRLAAMVADENARRQTALFAAPTSRTRFLFTEIAVTTAGVLLLHVTAALAIWAGAAITGAPLGIGGALGGALNTAPIAWLAVGAAALAVGWLPSMVGAIGALPVVGGFLLNVVAQGAHAPSWLTELSPFVHLGAVPDAAPDWAAVVSFLLIGAAVITAGVAGYARRDLTT